jgi:hypothetical protein
MQKGVGMGKISKGCPVVVDEGVSNLDLANILKGFERGEVYRVEDVEVVPIKGLLPNGYLKIGFIPDLYKRHLVNGIRTTNHDLMGSDRFVYIKDQTLSAGWFRLATAFEMNRHARSIL